MLKSIITEADFFGGEPKLVDNVSRYGARGVLIDENNLVAMELISANGFYKLPGGGIDLGERETDAFIREVSEEIGCNCEIIEKLGIVEEHNTKTGFCQVSFCFFARKVGECAAPRLTAAEKELGMSINWMSLEDASAVMQKSLDMAQDTKTKFILMRDKVIVDYLIEQLNSGALKL